MKKSIVIILMLIAFVLCTCPSLLYSGALFFASSSPKLAAQYANVSPQSDMGAVIVLVRVLGACIFCFGTAIPLVVGLITFRLARKKAVQTQHPQ